MRRLFLLLIAASLSAQYRPIDQATEWTFESPTPAYSTEDSSELMGTFQPGITVKVLGRDSSQRYWEVAFERYGQADILSLIELPNLAESKPKSFARVAEAIDGFPLLKKLLEYGQPWPNSPTELADYLFVGEAGYSLHSGSADAPTILEATAPEPVASAWGIRPLAAKINYSQTDNPSVSIEFWNKGDAFKSLIDPTTANRKLEEMLDQIQAAFPTYRKDPAANAAAITAVRIKEKVYLLPNDLRLSLRYDKGEYLILSIRSISRLEAQTVPEYDPATFHAQISSKVTTAKSGHIFIKDIPMIDQGDKGYCAAATLARVLQFYGYTVDVHAMADLAETEAQISSYDRGGTLRDNIISAMRRICNSTPFRLDKINKARPEAIREAIESGIPIIWFIPGHARLLIGIHPDNNEIVYSDSWGIEHQFKTATWDYFINYNQEMWILEPR